MNDVIHKTGLGTPRLQLILTGMVSCALLLGFAGLPQAKAEKALSSSDEPLEIKLNQTLDTGDSHYGDPFEAELTEDHRLGQRILPAGTLLKGKVEGGHPSMILGMPGYVSLDIQQAILPTGEIYQFEKDNQGGLKTKKYHHPQAHTGKGILLSSIPFAAISTATVLPLSLVAGMGYWQIAPISTATRMVTGAGWEMTGKHKNSPVQGAAAPTRIGYGMLRGTGLTGAYHMLTTSPEPNLKAGTVIALRLPEKDMNQLFEAGNATQTVQNSAPKQPTHTVIQPHDTPGLQPAIIQAQGGVNGENGKVPNSLATPSIQPVSVDSSELQSTP